VVLIVIGAWVLRKLVRWLLTILAAPQTIQRPQSRRTQGLRSDAC
jgi:hypothetical protein